MTDKQERFVDSLRSSIRLFLDHGEAIIDAGEALEGRGLNSWEDCETCAAIVRKVLAVSEESCLFNVEYEMYGLCIVSPYLCDDGAWAIVFDNDKEGRISAAAIRGTFEKQIAELQERLRYYELIYSPEFTAILQQASTHLKKSIGHLTSDCNVSLGIPLTISQDYVISVNEHRG